MATKAHIIVKDNKSKYYVYHHYDGYPDSVGKKLKDFIEYTDENNAFVFCNKLNKSDKQFEFENLGLHGDENYVYVIDFTDNSFVCYNTKTNVNGVDWCGIPENEVYNCKKEFNYIFS